MGLLLLMGNAFAGAFDSLGSGMESAWSVARRMRAPYGGPAIRLRRDLDDAERDFFGAGPSGAVSTSEVAAFCGAGNGFLRTLYDQSGNARHFEQATNAVQPIVCESGVAVTQGGRLAAKFVAADARRLAVGSSTGLYNFLHTTGGTVSIVSKANDTAAVKGLLNSNGGSTGANGILLTRNTSEAVFFGASRLSGPTNGWSVQDTSTSTSTGHDVLVIQADPDNATAASRLFGWQNGTSLEGFVNSESGTPNTGDASANMTLGAYSSGTFAFDGTIQECVVYSALISAATRSQVQNAMGSFYGITVA